MKINHSIFLLLSVFCIGFSSCKKDTGPNMETFKIVKEMEKITAGTTSATITGTFEYPGKINSLKVRVGTSEQLFGSDVFVAEVNGKAYSVNVTGLRSGTLYHYRYEVDYGSKEDFLSEISSFSTQSESPTVKTLEWQVIDSTTFRIKCKVEADGGQEVTERGICWNTYSFGDPTMDDETKPYSSGGLGEYNITMTALASNTVYHVRAYARNGTGIGFGEELAFRTGGEVTKPKVSTVEVSEVTYNTASCLCNVSSDGGLELTEHGVCWGLEPDPTINVHHAIAVGTETGNYTVTISGLVANTTYHVRAYATNEKGTNYGEELTFATTEGLPTVTTAAITNVNATSAQGGGEVTDEGASNVTERGICWGINHTPTINDFHDHNGTGEGGYTVQMTNLTANTKYYVRAYAKNAQGTSYGAEVDFTATEGLPMVNTLDVTDITANTAIGHGKVSNQGGSTVTERGICWSTEPSPTISGSHIHSGTGSGEFEVSLTNLTPGTKYYVRAYAMNTQGLTYGEQKDFTTATTMPTVITGGINGTIVSGEVTDEGGATVTERGVCWSTSHNPTTSGPHGSSGTGVGTFSVELTDLAPGTTYYVRAYATNVKGTAYGSEKALTTEANLPTVTTSDVTNIQQTTAQGGGNVTDDGGADVTERGVCWSTNHNPTISGSHANSGIGTGGFTVSMTGLTANTKYYVRAYAKNSAGISYGNEVDFTTAQNVSAPSVTTTQVTNITQTTATGGGNVTSTGGAPVTERGICWSTSHNPTTSGSHASNGTGTGTYTVNMTGLTANTTYYVRAYAINSAGTAYGSEVSFTTLSGGGTAPQGAINGKFTINASGDKVYFSRGNLQYKASTNTWRFAENQWDYVGEDNSNISPTYNDWIDLFGWGTSGYNHGAVCYQPWSTSQTNSDYYAYGQYNYNLYDQTGQADWGYNPISNGGNTTNTWRTLTGGGNGEWKYILNTRSASTVNGTANARYAKAKVNNVQGVILFPDIYTHPSGVAQPVGINDTGNTCWNGNNYSATDFGWMEQNGAVFLPAAGNCWGTSVYYVGSYGDYWSASYKDSNYARYLYFSSGYFDRNSIDRCYGLSVRLVRLAEN